MVSDQDISVITECLKATANGPFFPDWEFPTLFGLERAEILSIAEDFTPNTSPSENTVVAVCNTFANLFGYPHGHFTQWSTWVSVSPEEAMQAFERWRQTCVQA